MRPLVKNTHRYVLLIVLVLFANVISFALFYESQRGPVSAPERYPVLEQDSSVYTALADNLLVHHAFSASSDLQPFQKWPIGYPLFLAVTKYISGGFMLAIVLQVLAGIGAVLLLYRMAQVFLPPDFALIPALLFALDPYVLFLNTSILTDGLFTSLFIVIIYALFFWESKKTVWHFFGIGALLGMATLLRSIAQFLVIVLPFLYLFVNRISLSRFWRPVAAFIAGFFLLVTPWMLRNEVVFGTPKIANISNFDLLFYDAQRFLLLKELRAERPQPILLSSSPLYTTEAQAAATRVGDRITRDLTTLTPPGGNPENYYGTLGLRYVLQDPFYYGYFHLINTTSFFLQDDIRGYQVELRSIELRNGIPSTPVSLFSAWHDLQSKKTSLSEKINAVGILLPSGFNLGLDCALVFFSFLALSYARRNRLLLVPATLVVYLAVLTGPVGIDTPRLHIPAEPFLFLLAATGVGIGIHLLKHLYQHRVEFSRFLIAGGTATAFDMALLYIGTGLLKINYLISASLALVVAYTVSFFLQKYWTFRDKNSNRIFAQAFGYASFVAFNIALNAFLLWFFVHELFLWYLAAQFVAAIIIALLSYVVYKKILFGTFLRRLTIPHAKTTE